MILNNDKTVISCHSGTAFPSTNTREGMLCYRTDLTKLYQLVDASASGTEGWKVVADLSGDARNLDGGEGSVINYDKKDLNSWVDMPTGFYQGTNMLHAPSGDTAWRIIQVRQNNSDGYASQLAFSVNSNILMFRKELGGSWSDWLKVYTGTDGSTVSGLNADKVDGKEPSNASGGIALNNGTLNTNLNADKLDGYHAGNASGNIPLNNGVLNSGLNADQLDSKHAGNASGNIPINNGTLNTNLNAEMVGGTRIGNILTLDSSSNATKTVNWIKINNANVVNFDSRSYSGSTQGYRNLEGSGTTGHLDAQSSSGSGNLSSTTYLMNVNTGIGAGSYTLYNIIQRLINCSHTHTVSRSTTVYDCNCNCNESDCCNSDDNCA